MMDTKKNITIADMVNSVFSYWYIVVISTIVVGGCFFLYSKNSKPIFKTSSILFLDFEKSMTTPFGDYIPDNLNSRDYLRLLKDEKCISETINEFGLAISVEEFYNEFKIVHPEYEKSKSVTLEITLSNKKVDEVLSYHVNNFIKNLKQYHQNEAVNYFKSEFKRDLQSLNRELEYLEKIIPIKDSVLRSMTPSNFSANQLDELRKQGFQVSMNDFFSPEYRLLSKELVDFENSLFKVKNEISRLKFLESKLLRIEKQMKSEKITDTEMFHSQNYVSVFAESDKVINVSKSVFKYTVLGLFVGLLLALFIILLIVINAKNKVE